MAKSKSSVSLAELDSLFEEEKKIQSNVRSIAEGLLDLSEFILAKTALELASAEAVGKRIRRSCDQINEEVHFAKKKLGILLSRLSKASFKREERFLSDMENELSLIHGDIEAIGGIAESFYKSENRTAAFENLNRHYSELVENVTKLLVSAK